jgi:hypothetical protein
MSSRHQKEKRLRPRNDPYKRDHFNKSQYLRIQPATTSSIKPLEEVNLETEDYDNMDDYDDVN